MRKSLVLILTLSTITIMLGIRGVGHTFAQEKQRLDTISTTVDQPAGREGGQGGKSPHLEKRSEASQTSDEGRVGGHSGKETSIEERTTSYGSVSGTRVGGQSGMEPRVGTSSSKAK